MNHFGLFEGIGGFSLAARWMGWKTVAWCEIDPFCQQVLKYHFPDAQPYGDIKTTDFAIYRGKIDILTGGFPCQPFSLAGKRKGTEDDRHLWPEMLRAIREIQPCWIVGENVRGLTNWNGGMVFDEVQAEMEAEGYEVLPFLLPACAVNAPHRRDRVWFVAYSVSAGAGRKDREVGYEGRGTRKGRAESVRQTYGQAGASGVNAASANGIVTNTNGNDDTGRLEYRGYRSEAGRGKRENEQQEGRSENGERLRPEPGTSGEDVANTEEQRLQKWHGESVQHGAYSTTKRHDSIPCWHNFPTQPPLCIRDDGLSDRLAGITFSKHRNESIKAYGNSIVPQVAYEIFKAISLYNDI
jgi:DNA (cytosine-5)-methyltransferase 1